MVCRFYFCFNANKFDCNAHMFPFNIYSFLLIPKLVRAAPLSFLHLTVQAVLAEKEGKNVCSLRARELFLCSVSTLFIHFVLPSANWTHCVSCWQMCWNAVARNKCSRSTQIHHKQQRIDKKRDEINDETQSIKTASSLCAEVDCDFFRLTERFRSSFYVCRLVCRFTHLLVVIELKLGIDDIALSLPFRWVAIWILIARMMMMMMAPNTTNEMCDKIHKSINKSLDFFLFQRNEERKKIV